MKQLNHENKSHTNNPPSRILGHDLMIPCLLVFFVEHIFAFESNEHPYLQTLRQKKKRFPFSV